MARIARTKLENVTHRDALEVRVEPHYQTIEPGRLLGLIAKGKGEAGTWVARVRVKGLNKRTVLGYSCVQPKEADANGNDRLSFNQARQAAMDWNPEAEEAARNVCTLTDAVEQHRTFTGKKSNKLPENMEAAYNALRFKVLGLNRKGKRRKGVVLLDGGKPVQLSEGEVYALDGTMPVASLTTEMLRTLRDSWIDPENAGSRATALRNWSNLHSCLEQAYLKESNGILSPAAWQKVDVMDQKCGTRDLHFTDEQTAEILAFVRASDAPVADYFEGLYRVGARPGDELMRLAVRDFRSNERNLFIKKSKTGPRTIGLSPLALALFQRLTAGRSANAPLFSPDGVREWDVCEDRARIKTLLVAAVRHVLGDAAPQDDTDIVPYAFRHTFISRRLGAGMAIRAVAKNCGTSDFMIRTNYEHALRSETEQALADSDPKVGLRLVA